MVFSTTARKKRPLRVKVHGGFVARSLEKLLSETTSQFTR